MPIQECEKDKPVRFTKTDLGDSQTRFPYLAVSYTVTVLSTSPPCRSGILRGGRERPPFFASRIGTVGSAIFTRAVPPESPGGSLPSH